MIAVWILLGILLLLFLLLVCILYLKTCLVISYKDDKFTVKATNGFIRYTFKQKEKTQKQEEAVTKDSIEKDIEKKKTKLTHKKSFLWSFLREMRYKIEIKKVKIKVDYGTDDPADTGVLYGVIWAAIGNIYQVFNQYFVFDFPETEINPDFENKLFKIEFYGIIKVRIVHIINALIKSRKGKS
ncbi:MAG: DUF2953 domain-containing protein [Ruminococcaceae bacterium]|nr:DUF2953 domain-containing protein [Oscillospiraceae bacterium]